MSQEARMGALSRFKSSQVPILVATGLSVTLTRFEYRMRV